MTSPFTGGKVILKSETTRITYRGEDFFCNRYYYVCEDTGIEFTDAELDDKGLSEVHEQYRKCHGIPSPSELTNLRELIGIPSRTMSQMLGLGENQYRLYEAGEMPSESIGKMLATLLLPEVVEKYIESSRQLFSPQKYHRALSAIHREKKTIYHVNIDFFPFKMVSMYASPSRIKTSRSRWNDARDSVLFANLEMITYA